MPSSVNCTPSILHGPEEPSEHLLQSPSVEVVVVIVVKVTVVVVEVAEMVVVVLVVMLVVVVLLVDEMVVEVVLVAVVVLVGITYRTNLAGHVCTMRPVRGTNM